MVKFGRKFFFDKVYTKKNYTIPIIIGAVFIVAITTTFLITRYYKRDKSKEIKITFNQNIEMEIYTEIPSTEKFIKEIKNIEYKDLEIIYPDDLKTVEDTSACENEETENCKKLLAASLGEYKITIKSDKLEKKENSVTLNVVDTTKPTLELKEVTITEGKPYQLTDFIKSCSDNSKIDCTYEYATTKDEEGNEIDYSKYTSKGEYSIKIIAKDSSGNTSEEVETKLTINKKKTENNNNNNNSETNKPQTCKYGDLSYSNSYVIATKIEDTKCAISAEEAESISNKAAIIHNKKLVEEIQKSYLKNTIDAMYLEGEIVYDIVYGPVFNKSNKGVVGYFLMSEARQTVNGVTTTLARYYIDENGNRVWKINTLNLE